MNKCSKLYLKLVWGVYLERRRVLSESGQFRPRDTEGSE